MPSYSMRDLCQIMCKAIKRRLKQREGRFFSTTELESIAHFALPGNWQNKTTDIINAMYDFGYIKINEDKTLSLVD